MHYRIHRVHEWQPGPPTGRIGGPTPRMLLVSKDILEFRDHLDRWHPVPIKVDPIPDYPSLEQELVKLRFVPLNQVDPNDSR